MSGVLSGDRRVEVPLTLAEPVPTGLGVRDGFGLRANLGLGLLLPAPAAREPVPATVLLRGLLGGRASWLPTGLNVLQCLGWATLGIVVIAEASSRALDAPRWPFVLAAAVLATGMALRPLGVRRVLARFSSADDTRHARGARTAFLGTAGGYGLPTFGMLTLGLLAMAAYGAAGLDVVDALLAVPLGLVAVLVLVAVGLAEAFANVSSSAVSAQDAVARLDRRVVVASEPFLFLLGAVFVPLAGVPVVAHYLVPRGARDVPEDAPARPLLFLPWAAGVAAYQLTVPTFAIGPGAGWTAWWAERQAELGLPATHGLSAAVVSLTIASVLTAAVTLPGALTAGRPGGSRTGGSA